MTQTLSSILYAVGSLLVLWAAAVGVASVVVHTRVDWRATAMGRHVMAYMSVIAALLVLSVIRFWFGNDPWWFQVIRLVVFTGVPLVMTQRLMLQIRAQRVPPTPPPAGEDARIRPESR